MAIKKQNRRANFTPTFAGTKSNGKFRFWCQKVLPLVYDDSLSYYELLGKVIDYLNHVIEDVGSTESNVDSLLNAYNELQGYVNNYFDTVDLQGEINKRLDEMTEDGTFYELFGDDMVEAAGDVMEQWIQEHIEAQVQDPPVVLITDKSLSVAGDVADSYSCGNSVINLFNMIAPKYDNTRVYNKGDYCIVRYNSWPWGGENIWDLSPIPAKLYKCKIDMQQAESWDSSHWDLIGNFSSEISNLLQNIDQIQTLFGMWGDIGSALQTCFENVAWVNQNGEEYVDDLMLAINNANPVNYITAVFDQGQNIIYDTDSLDDLRQYLTVTAYYLDGTHKVKTTYGLSGTLTEGASTITASYAGKTTTFNVIVTHDNHLYFTIIHGGFSTENNQLKYFPSGANCAQRAMTNPVGHEIEAGKTYTISIGQLTNTYSYAVNFLTVNDPSSVDGYVVEGVDKVICSYTARLASGWKQDSSLQYSNADGYNYASFVFKKNDDSNITDSDIAAIQSAFNCVVT